MISPQLCQLAGSWGGNAMPLHTVAETKHNGWRALYLRDHDGKPGLWTRGGIPIEGTGHILHELAAWERAAGEPMFFDGEFVVDGPDTLAATKHWCETGWKMGGTAGTFWLFDGFPLSDWRRGGSERPWYVRKALLEAYALSVASDAAHAWDWRPGSRGQGEGSEPVKLVEHAYVWTPHCVIDMAREVWAAGLEGLMLKDAEAPYRRNRSDAWLKVKQGQAWTKRWRIAA